MSTLADQQVDSIVVVRARLDIGSGYNPLAIQGLAAALFEYIALGVCLTDSRFIPLERTTDGGPGEVPKEPLRIELGKSYRLLSSPGLSRTGSGPDWVSWVGAPLVQESFTTENATLLASMSLFSIRRLEYRNPIETVLEILLPSAAGGGLIAFLTWATTLRAARKKAMAEADSVAIANELAIAQASRDAQEFAERLVDKRLESQMVSARLQTENANARYRAAEAEALELANAKSRVLIAQEIEDYLVEHPNGRSWSEAQITALLRPPITQAAVEVMARLEPRFELLPPNLRLEDE